MEAFHVSWIIADFTIHLVLLGMSPEGLNIATVFFTYEAVYFSMVLGLVIVELYFCFSLETTLVTLEQLRLATVFLSMTSEVRHPYDTSPHVTHSIGLICSLCLCSPMRTLFLLWKLHLLHELSSDDRGPSSPLLGVLLSHILRLSSLCSFTLCSSSKILFLLW